jgi:biopolymer transport protein ExbB
MKMIVRWMPLVLLTMALVASSLSAEDMRELQVQAHQAREALIQKAAAEKAAADHAAAESRARILEDRKALEKAIAELENSNRRLAKEVRDLDDELRRLDEKEQQFTRKLEQIDSVIQEMVGVIRVNAKDIDALIAQNLQTALGKNTPSFLAAVAEESRFPGMDDVRGMASALLNQIKSCGEVDRRKGMIVDRSGRQVEADILLLGPFTAAYRIEDEVGFLNYSSAGAKLYALSRLPSSRTQKQITRYMEGQSETAPIDISRGGALRQLTHELELWEQIPKGGPIVWPILLVLAVGVLIVIERTVFLARKHLDAEGLIHQIEALSVESNWQACRQACAEYAQKPVARVLEAGLLCCHMQREEMENALQEAILKEIPPMERFLSTLGMLAAIAPLLGLLGTVTGMIDTFHVITLHGTGDPRLMSGGISEALVTTMLGLSVAIPLMLSQTLLNRSVDKKIGQIEEKAVALVNILHKNRGTS